MAFETALSYLGKTSLVSTQNLFHEVNKSPMVLGHFGASLVEYKPERKKTQSAPLPVELKSKYGKYCMAENIPPIEIPDVPADGTYIAPI